MNLYQILQEKQWVDLSHQIDEHSPKFPALPALEQKDLFTLKDGFHVQQFSVVGQYGTHIDAPIHFVEQGRWLDDIPLKDLLLPLYVIDKSQEVTQNNGLYTHSRRYFSLRSTTWTNSSRGFRSFS